MGTKLMCIMVVLAVFGSTCSTTKKNQSNDFFVKEDDYINAFKTAFLCGCLDKGTRGNFYKFLSENNDLGLFTEGDLISHFKVNEADSLGRMYSNRIKPFNYGDGRGKVPNFSRCMGFALSSEIDSIARASYKQSF